MKFTHIREEKKVTKWVIKGVRYPFGTVASVKKLSREVSCVFCGKKYKDCKGVGVVMTDKGSRRCCDDCAESFKSRLETGESINKKPICMHYNYTPVPDPDEDEDETCDIGGNPQECHLCEKHIVSGGNKSDRDCDRLLKALDAYAQKYDRMHFGLPIHILGDKKPLKELREIVKTWK